MKKLLIFILSIFLLFSCSNKIHKENETVYAKKMAKPVFTEEINQDSDGVPDVQEEESPEPIILESQLPESNTENSSVNVVSSTIRNENNNSQAFEQINNEINNNTTLGEISYVLNDTMIVGVITKVNMTISKNVTKEQLISEVETFTENNLHSESIKISPVMRAKLTDPSGVNFRIIPTSNEEQIIQEGDFTLWTWNVTPLTKGDNPLILTVDIIIGNKSKTIPVFDSKIYVYSNEKIIEKILGFLNENWKYFLSSLIIPFLVFLYKKRQDKKNEKN